jgi:hypothetical protein
LSGEAEAGLRERDGVTGLMGQMSGDEVGKKRKEKEKVGPTVWWLE